MKDFVARTRTGLRSPAVIMALIEIVMLLWWAGFVTLPYMNFDPDVVPAGREYLSVIQANHIWTRAQTCGSCALWNGSLRGGAPAFADVYGSFMHPLVILTTWFWGVINGAKLVLVIAFFTAGLAQWWLAHELGLHPLARLWTAAMAVAAGSLAGRMELGMFGIVLSTAMCALTIPAVIALFRSGSQRATVVLGITLALVIVAGQGYMQIGLALTLLVAIVLVPGEKTCREIILRQVVWALLIAFLLAAPFLITFLHFLPEFVKDVDPSFKSAQAFANIPLNLVINDYAFYNSTAFGKLPYPYLYVNYIGWVPVLLAVWGLFGRWSDYKRRIVFFLLGFALLSMWIASAEPFTLLSLTLPLPWLVEQIVGVRHLSVIAGLAVPPILALAGLGLDRLLNEINWLQIRLTPKTSTEGFSFDTTWLLIVPLALALANAQSFGSVWIRTIRIEPETQQIIDALRTPDLQWVNPPYGEHLYIEPAVAAGLKLHFGIRPWNWRDRALPEPMLEAGVGDAPLGMTQSNTVGDMKIFSAPERQYAVVTHADASRTVCSAHGIGGDIDVACDLAKPGTLVIEENSWDGWSASVNGKTLALKSGQWLSVDLPAGKQTIQFRYRPWDVLIGFFLFIVGVVLSARLFFQRKVVSAG